MGSREDDQYWNDKYDNPIQLSWELDDETLDEEDEDDE